MNHDEARELLPWYAAGSLEAEEARQVAKLVSNSDELAQELKQLRLVQDAVFDVGEEEPQFRPEMIQEALHQIDAMEANKVVYPSWDKKVKEAANEYLRRLQWGSTPAFARVAVVAQFALIALFSVALLNDQPGDQVTETLSGSNVVPDTRQHINLAFNAGITEVALRQYLISLNAEIVSGPSALGIYTIAVNEPFDMQLMLPQIKESELIQYVAPAME
jgi:anti-sigma factor RsiW